MLPKAVGRLKVLSLIMLLIFVALMSRLWYLQVLASERYVSAANSESRRTVETDALRGNIYDTDGRILVENRPDLEVRVTQDHLGENPEAVLLRLSRVLGIPVKEISADLRDKKYYTYQPIPVAEFVSKDVYFYIGEHQDLFPGVEVTTASVRHYPQGKMAAHVFGYLNLIKAQELEDPAFADYGQNALVGRTGLEKTYERFLRGTKGVDTFVVNAAGRNLRQLRSDPARPGSNLILSMDMEIQKIAEEELAAGLKRARGIYDFGGTSGTRLRADAGAVVVLDPKTFGVRAMATWPTYDPSWFVRGLSQQQASYVFTDRRAPSLNRAFQQNYTPGSTFKPPVALVAMKARMASMYNYYNCPATYRYPGDRTTEFHNWSDYDIGYMSIARAIEVSCDTIFYDWGGKFWSRWSSQAFGAQAEPFQAGLRRFGFGRPTGIDLPYEASGNIPDAAYARANPTIFPDGWTPGGDILMAIGSGYVQATPLQMARAYAVIANGGKLCTPHLVDRIVDTEGRLVRKIDPRCRRLPFSDVQIDYIRRALGTVTRSGTAALAFRGFPLTSIPVGGKTGTAVRPGFQSTSWFASMVPVENPEYIVVVMAEQGGFGSTTAAPIARRIIERIYGLDTAGPVTGGTQD